MEQKHKTSVDIELALWQRLQPYLAAHNISLSDWIDKIARKEMGLPPKFSYKTVSAAPPPETQS